VSHINEITRAQEEEKEEEEQQKKDIEQHKIREQSEINELRDALEAIDKTHELREYIKSNNLTPLGSQRASLSYLQRLLSQYNDGDLKARETAKRGKGRLPDSESTKQIKEMEKRLEKVNKQDEKRANKQSLKDKFGRKI